MIDSDDVEDVLIVGLMSGGGWFWTFLVIVAFVILSFIFQGNKEDCDKKFCYVGNTPKLMSNDCICVEKAQ